MANKKARYEFQIGNKGKFIIKGAGIDFKRNLEKSLKEEGTTYKVKKINPITKK
jgi:hypothetical protein